MDLRVPFDSLPGLLLALSPDQPAYKILDVSDAFAAAANQVRDNIAGRNLPDCFPNAAIPLGASLARVIDTGQEDRITLERYDLFHHQPDGHWTIVHQPVRGPDGAIQFILHRAILEPHKGDALLDHLVDARKQVEAHLRQQWRTFDIALSNTPDFTYIFDLDGRFTYVNRALLSLWQKPLEEAVGKNFFELGYPVTLASRLGRQIQEVIDTKAPVRDHTPFTGPTGETRHYEYIFVPVLGAGGLVEAVAGSTRDITDRQLVEDVVFEDRRRWRDLLLLAPAAIAVLRGPEHRFEWANTAYLELINQTAAGIFGKPLAAVIPEVAAQMYIGLLDTVYSTGEPFTGHEALVQLNRGSQTLTDLYMNFVYLPTRDESGKINGIFVHATDVTGMVLARQHIEETGRQFRTLAETIPHLAWMADETGHIFWFNRRWYDYTGTTIEEMRGWGWQKVHDPAVLPSVLTAWNRAIATGEPFEMVFPIRSSTGAYGSFLTRVEPVRDSRGRVARWFGTHTDITDQLTTEKELRRINRELEEFAYVASHDLQEPLRMVNIYTQLILRELGHDLDTPGTPLDQYAAYVQQGVTRMQALIQDLLTFSRAVHAEALPVGTVDLEAALGEACSVLRSRIDESGSVVQAGPLPTVRGDLSQMAHVFQNLFSNAMKYRRPGVPARIEVCAKPAGNAWIVSVRDNGIGFEPQYGERIFGLFKRLHKEEYPGTGLGLAICKRIVERYNGRIWAEGKPGEGATFFLSLPRIEES